MRGPLARMGCRVIVGALLLVALVGNAHAVRTPPVDWLEPCEVRGVSDPAWCGAYDVYEDRASRKGRKIGIYVEVIPALAETPHPDPVFYFMGGPGAPATIATGGMVAGLRNSHRVRDLVFIDQRGTGRSGALSCGGSSAARSAGDSATQAYLNEFLAPDMVRQCLADQTEADVRLYTTPIAMDDIDEIRAALGYDKINIMGGSYGTRACLIYMRRHAEHVRSATLFGTAPTDMENPLPFSRAVERGVRATFDACALEPACHGAFPDLHAKWRGLTEQFASGSVTVKVRPDAESELETVTITRGVFADSVRHTLYTVAGATELPLIVDAASRGDFTPFVQRKVRQARGFGNLLSMGMFLTVTCAEDIQFISEDDIQRTTSGTFLGDYRVRRQQQACALWPKTTIDASYQKPVVVDTPTLLITGIYDTATPYEGADRVARDLPNSRHIIVPNQGHGRANPTCQFQVTEEFLEKGSPEDLDVSCFATTQRPPFRLPEGRE